MITALFYFPENNGERFSLNADSPSWWSFVCMQIVCKAASLLNSVFKDKSSDSFSVCFIIAKAIGLILLAFLQKRKFHLQEHYLQKYG